MNLSLSDLHRQVSRLVQQESGDCTGKLRGNVAANKETTFQGLTIASGARESEKSICSNCTKPRRKCCSNSRRYR